jgi:hypothetical protein
MALCVAVIAATIWMLHKRPEMTAISPVVNKVQSVAERNWKNAMAKSGRLVPIASAQQKSVIAQPSQSGSNSAGAVANSEPRTAVATSENTVEKQSVTEAAPRVPPQPAAPAAATGAQSSGENAAAVAPTTPMSVPAAEGTTTVAAPNGSSSAEAVQQNQSIDAGEKNPASETPQVEEKTGSDATASSGIPQSQSGEASSAVPSAGSEPAKDPAQPAPTVSQPSPEDIPELLRRADAAEERGDYVRARQNYELVLKLDPSNGPARAGLYRIKAMEQPH